MISLFCLFLYLIVEKADAYPMEFNLFNVETFISVKTVIDTIFDNTSNIPGLSAAQQSKLRDFELSKSD